MRVFAGDPFSVLEPRLQAVTRLAFVSSSAADTGWSGRGEGLVQVSTEGNSVLFNESGQWRNVRDQAFAFSNTYRFTPTAQGVDLAHLRLGKTKPVFLFTLVAQSPSHWVCAAAHQCGDDQYRAELYLSPSEIRLDWRIVGPAKNETLRYSYLE